MLYVIIILSAVIAFVLEEFLFRTANKKKILDNPGGRRLHKGAIPRVGGWAFFVVIAFMTLLFIPLFHEYTSADMKELLPFLFGTGCLFIVGVVDDVEELGSKIKFAFQIIASIPMVAKIYGFKLLEGSPETGFTIGFDFMDLVKVGFMMFFVLWTINSINLIDGIDGLSGSIGVMTMLPAVYLLDISHNFIIFLVWVSLTTSICVFLCYNFANGTSKRKMFMGDAGSLVMGYVIAICMLHGWCGDIKTSEYMLPICSGICIVPMLDVIVVSLTRYIEGRNPFKADLSHLHHKFLYCGLSARKSLIWIICICLSLATTNYFFYDRGFLTYITIDVACILVMYAVLWYNKRKVSKQIKRHWDSQTGMYVEDLVTE
ncbi:MAG: undecaprenyl/decaprenyl-phosphate alpha-N-acetylglucosaminyl 1-phosphate transferase [Paludibacteraceae bacterium]|nr:undecaprenyl/decaprenyl-phosphate alpha-N-acetylglucosaminyl 1-phosphate transferase [Paludibacteraceae bacterium]